MIRLRRILKDYDETGALHALVNLSGFLDDHTFVTKSGDVGVLLRVRGVEAESREPAELDAVARRFETSLRTLDESFRLYQYLIKRERPAIPHRAVAHPVVQQAIADRLTYLQTKPEALYSLEVWFAVLYEGRAIRVTRLAGHLRACLARLARACSRDRTIQGLEQDLDRTRSILHTHVDRFVLQLHDLVDLEIAPKADAFHLLRQLLNYGSVKADGFA